MQSPPNKKVINEDDKMPRPSIQIPSALFFLIICLYFQTLSQWPPQHLAASCAPSHLLHALSVLSRPAPPTFNTRPSCAAHTPHPPLSNHACDSARLLPISKQRQHKATSTSTSSSITHGQSSSLTPPISHPYAQPSSAHSRN